MILWSNHKCQAWQKLLAGVSQSLAVDRMEILFGLVELNRRLRQPEPEAAVLVLLTRSREDLEGLKNISSLLQDCQTILLLPDRGKETISLGHRLRPRYLSYIDGDMADVVAVLQKMRQNMRARVE